MARRVDLETGLAPEAEEERDAAVVGVGACADVLFGRGLLLFAGTGEAGEGRVVQEAENVARGAALTEVAVAEEGGRLDIETYAEEVVEFEGEMVAVVVWPQWCLSMYVNWKGYMQYGPCRGRLTDSMVRLTEVVNLALIRGHTFRQGLICFAIYELSEIERSISDLGVFSYVRRRVVLRWLVDYVCKSTHSLKSPTYVVVSL